MGPPFLRAYSFEDADSQTHSVRLFARSGLVNATTPFFHIRVDDKVSS